MTNGTKQTYKQQVKMFGYSIRGMQEEIECSDMDPHAIVLSILSNVQEQISLGLKEEARQALNRAKWIISSYKIDR